MRQVRTRATSRDDEGDLVVEIPQTLSSDLAAVAARIVSRTEAMGLLRIEDHAYDRAALVQAVQALQSAGIGRQTVLEKDVERNPRGALELLNAAIEDSPHPPTEWEAVIKALGIDLVVALTGISASSTRRYASGERVTPDDVAERLHFVAMVIADLAGSYNVFGVRRWFTRRRRALGNATPAERLSGGEWSADDEAAQEVASLARALTGLGAT